MVQKRLKSPLRNIKMAPYIIIWIFFRLILINKKSDKSVFLWCLYKIKLIVPINGSNLGTKIDLSSLHTNYAVGN